MRPVACLLLMLLAGCTATQNRHAVSVSALDAAPAAPVAGRVLADFEDAAQLESWHKYVVEGSVHDPELALTEGALQITADRSAGLFWHQLDLKPASEPILRWRWRVSHTFGTSTPLSPEFDNFPARVLVGFDYGWQDAGPAASAFRKKVQQYAGVDPPARAICYTLGGKLPASQAIDAAFGEGRIVVINLRSDNLPTGQWLQETRNIAADYRAVFGQPAPAVAAIAVGSDNHRQKDFPRVQALFDDFTAFPASAATQFQAELEAPELQRQTPPLVWWIIGLCVALAGATGAWWLWRTRVSTP